MKSEQIIEKLKDCKQFFKEYSLSYALENNRGLLPSGKSADLIFALEDAVCELERLSQINKRLYAINKHRSKHVEQLQKERDEARRCAENFRALYKNITGATGAFPWEEDSE